MTWQTDRDSGKICSYTCHHSPPHLPFPLPTLLVCSSVDCSSPALSPFPTSLGCAAVVDCWWWRSHCLTWVGKCVKHYLPKQALIYCVCELVLSHHQDGGSENSGACLPTTAHHLPLRAHCRIYNFSSSCITLLKNGKEGKYFLPTLVCHSSPYIFKTEPLPYRIKCQHSTDSPPV